MNNEELNQQVIFSKLAEMEECVEKIKNASEIFDTNLSITNGVGFYDACSIKDTYDKFKDLNSFPKEYCELLTNYINEVRNETSDALKREHDVVA